MAAQLSMRKRRMEAEAALKDSQATLQSFYDSSPYLMGVIELEQDEIVALHVNAATGAFFGTEWNLIPGKTGEQLGIPALLMHFGSSITGKVKRTAIPFDSTTNTGEGVRAPAGWTPP